MDLKSPLPFTHSRATSATFPLTHGSRSDDIPFAELGDRRSTPRHVHHHSTSAITGAGTGTGTGTALEESVPTSAAHAHPSRPRPRLDPLGLDGTKTRHKHSKSRELRLPRPMSHLASSASARGLLPTWSGRDKERDSDESHGLLRPMTRETTRSRWGSESTSRSRRGSLLDVPEQHERLGPIRRQEIRSMEDLEAVKKRRKMGEEYLRSALSSIGTQATDVTRRLDYTYYNLLEKITALNSTIGSFQDLSDSAATLLADFDHETSTLDQEIRKQIIELKNFEPQSQKADALQERMNQGRKRVEDLGARLESVKSDIDSWERREMEWQERTSRRLRIFWAVIGGAFFACILAWFLQNWPSLAPARGDGDSNALGHGRVQQDAGAASAGFDPFLSESLNQSASSGPTTRSRWESLLQGDAIQPETAGWYPSSLADRRESLAAGATESTSGGGGGSESDAAQPTHDPLQFLDEL
ncbi:hypothetical protein N7532_000123 [Penicillium argentinense]|uniref:Uncharacterized protein n=1 Tax=Penicillium argentinense TaxID=1131581 RepID=A0A9W9KNK0_9EURO|nr:uncharacterized protein N7532_000123 [Penicillium argentinense]KAJ5112078.1 hypothetical protein N7532_000123 [Penicillium argentinense]